MKRTIILASQSPRRIQLLHQIGIEALVMPDDRPEKINSTDPEMVVRQLSAQKAGDVANRVFATNSQDADNLANNICALSTQKSHAFANSANSICAAATSSQKDDDKKDGAMAGCISIAGTLYSVAALTDAVVIGADTVVSIDGKILGKPKTHEEAVAMIRELSGRAHQVFTGVTVITRERTETFAEKTTVHVAAMTEEEIRTYAASSEPMDKAGAYGIQGTFAKYITGIEGDYYNVVGLPVAHLYQVLKRT